MKTAAGLALASLLCSGAFAQYGTSGFGNVVFPGTGHAPFASQRGFGTTGFGNVVFPGTGQAPRVNPFANPLTVTNPGFASRLGSTVSGFNSGFRGNAFHNRNYVYVPYAYPVYTGGYYPPYPAPEQGQPNVTVIYPPQAAPVTIINQIPSAAPAGQTAPSAGERMESYQSPAGTPAPSADSNQGDSYYLIAFKDHSIYPAVAYWVDGDTLHYFTKGNVHNQASLSLVDRPLTERLNRERDVTIRLP